MNDKRKKQILPCNCISVQTLTIYDLYDIYDLIKEENHFMLFAIVHFR